MKIIEYLKNLWWEKEIKPDMMVFTRYKIKVHLNTGEELSDYWTTKYYAINCSIGQYFLSARDGLNLSDSYYPKEAIKCIEEEEREEEVVYLYRPFIGIGGLTKDEIEENHKRYKDYIDRYKKEMSKSGDRE